MITPMTKCACCGEPMIIAQVTIKLTYGEIAATEHRCPKGCWKQTFPNTVTTTLAGCAGTYDCGPGCLVHGIGS